MYHSRIITHDPNSGIMCLCVCVGLSVGADIRACMSLWVCGCDCEVVEVSEKNTKKTKKVSIIVEVPSHSYLNSLKFVTCYIFFEKQTFVKPNNKKGVFENKLHLLSTEVFSGEKSLRENEVGTG